MHACMLVEKSMKIKKIWCPNNVSFSDDDGDINIVFETLVDSLVASLIL